MTAPVALYDYDADIDYGPPAPGSITARPVGSPTITVVDRPAPVALYDYDADVDYDADIDYGPPAPGSITARPVGSPTITTRSA